MMNDLYLTEDNLVMRHLIKEMYATFPDVNPSDAHFEDRIRIISDTKMFNYKEDKYIWAQEKGRLPTIYQVYFDGEHITNFEEDAPLDFVALEYFKGFKDKYQKKIIRLAPSDYVVRKAVESMPEMKATTKEEKMAVEVVKKLTREKKVLHA